MFNLHVHLLLAAELAPPTRHEHGRHTVTHDATRFRAHRGLAPPHDRQHPRTWRVHCPAVPHSSPRPAASRDAVAPMVAPCWASSASTPTAAVPTLGRAADSPRGLVTAPTSGSTRCCRGGGRPRGRGRRPPSGRRGSRPRKRALEAIDGRPPAASGARPSCRGGAPPRRSARRRRRPSAGGRHHPAAWGARVRSSW